MQTMRKIMQKRAGVALPIIGGMIAGALIVLPLTKWLMSFNDEVANVSERLEMQSIIQDHWHQLNEASFDDFEEAIAAKGNTFKESIGDKWEIATTFGPLGAYQNALCNEGASPDDEDRRCRKATISITSKENPALTQSFTSTRVASAGGRIPVVDYQNPIYLYTGYRQSVNLDRVFVIPRDGMVFMRSCGNYRSGDTISYVFNVYIDGMDLKHKQVTNVDGYVLCDNAGPYWVKKGQQLRVIINKYSSIGPNFDIRLYPLKF